MRVLITNTEPWGRGSFTVAQGILQSLTELGHEAQLFFPDTGIPSAELDTYLKNDHLYKIWKLPHLRNGQSIDSFPLMIPDRHPRSTNDKTLSEFSDADFQFYSQELKRQLSSVIDAFKPDIIECEHVWLCNYIVGKLGLPHVATAHHSDQLAFSYDRRMQPYAKESAQSAGYIFAISSSVKEEVVELYGIDPKSVIVTGNGYNQSVFAPRKLSRPAVLKELQLNLPTNAKIVTCVAKMSHMKGIDTLLMANKLIKPEDNIHFVIVGTGSVSEIMQLHSPQNYSLDRVHFLNQQSQESIAKLHNIADLSTLTSRSEGFGIAVLEAMGCGLPVVVTRSGGPEDFAVGEIVEPEDPKNLAAAILKLTHLQSEERQSLSQKAAEKARQYSWHSIAEQRLKYYLKAHMKV